MPPVNWRTEYRRPWKLWSLAFGIGLLIVGSYLAPAPDWDIPISFIMAICTYFAAPWSVWIVLTRQWRWLPAMLLATWFSVDGCYALYWSWQDPAALAWMRAANFPASLSLYGICALAWLYPGSLRQAWTALRGKKSL